MTWFVLAVTLAAAEALQDPKQTMAPGGASPPRLQIFLDCQTDCFSDFLREETRFVDFVRDRNDADVHVIVTSTGTGSGGQEYSVGFIGARGHAGRDFTLKAITGTGDPEDVRRRHLLNTLRIGLLQYLSRDGVPQNLTLDVELRQPAAAAGAPRRDPWNSWVFSIEGSAQISGEESNRQRQFSAEFSADRITPNWKITFGYEMDHEREEFDLDEDEPVDVRRREHDFNTLIVKGLGEHWSIGARGEAQSSTFDNIEFRLAAAPAVEYNLFPYSMYQRRQLRMQYAVGLAHQTYYEETIFQKFEETLPAHEFSATYDQRERWGSVEARIEWFQYLNDTSKYHLEAFGDLSWRIRRGLSISLEGSASRVRDQISLRRRGATQEEILLRLRELQSGYEYDFSVGFTYSFGSIFSSIVNPRFGQ
jgi:hypothetical protein